VEESGKSDFAWLSASPGKCPEAWAKLVQMFSFNKHATTKAICIASETPTLWESMLFSGPIPTASNFTGVGVFEQTLRFIKGSTSLLDVDTAELLRASGRSVCTFQNLGMCENNSACRDYLSKLHPGVCIRKDVLDIIPRNRRIQLAEIEATESKPWDEWKDLIFNNTTIMTRTVCATHPGSLCNIPRPLFDTSGSKCRAYSRRGDGFSNKPRGRQNSDGKLLQAWLKMHLDLMTALLIHENVSTFDKDTIDEIMSDVYFILHLLVGPEDILGPEIMRRPRLATIMIRRDKLKVMLG